MKRITAVLLALFLVIAAVPMTLTSGADSAVPIAEYNFDDQTTNDAVGGKNATLYNDGTAASASYTEGVSGKALKLSSKGSAEKLWLSVPYSVFGSCRDCFSISLWYNASGYNTSGEDSELFSFYNSSAEKFLFYSPASVAFQDKAFTMKWDGTYGYANIITPYRANNWVHLVYVVTNDGSRSEITAYVNGSAVEVDQGGEWANSLMSQLGIDTFTIGGKNPYKGGDTPACLFYGAVDEIKIYAEALSQSQAATIYEEDKANAPEPTEPTSDTSTEEPDEPVADGTLLAEYNFDKSSTEDSVAGKNAVLYNDAEEAAGAYVDGVSGKALKLSAKGTLEKYWLSVPYEVFGDSRDRFSLSLWYKANDYNTTGEDSELFSFYNSGAEKFVYYSPAAVEFQDKAFTMKWDGTYGYTNVISPYEEGKWTHLVFCVDASGNESYITAYVNGEAVETDRGENWANSLMSQLGIDTFTIGGKNPYKGGPTPMCLFYGAVDEIRLYSGVLTQTEAKTLYDEPGYHGQNDGKDDDPTGQEVSGKLLAEYNFDGGSTKDSVAGKNAALYNNSSRVSGKYVTGVSGKALQLSTKGAGDKMWLSVPYSVFDGNRDTFTLSMWYAATGYNSSGEDSELFSFYNSRAERFLFYSPAATAFQDKGFTMKWNGKDGYANVISPYAKNQWVHLVYVIKGKDDRSVITAYINGEPVEVDQGGNWANSTMNKLGIDTFTIGGKNPHKGGNTPACLFYGLIDEVRIYAGELTPADAKLLYRMGDGTAAVETAGAYSSTGRAADPADSAPGDGVLMAEYNFNYEHTKDSVGDHDATFYDNAAEAAADYIDGVAGKALRLSEKGTAEKFWLSVPIEAFGPDRDSISISLWYRADGYNTSGEDSELFSLYNSKAERFIFYSPAATAFQDKGFTFKWNGRYGYANVISPYAEGKWTHLVYVIKASGSQSVIKAYVNGKAVEVDQGGDWSDSLLSSLGIDTFTLGGKNPNKGGDPPACLFYGAIDEVKLYAGTLTQTDAKRLYEEPDGYVFVPEETEPETESTEPAEPVQEPTEESSEPTPTEPKQEEKTDPGSVIRTGLILTGSAAAVSIVGVVAALLFRKKRRG